MEMAISQQTDKTLADCLTVRVYDDWPRAWPDQVRSWDDWN
jgi:hypothetical protein